MKFLDWLAVIGGVAAILFIIATCIFLLSNYTA